MFEDEIDQAVEAEEKAKNGTEWGKYTIFFKKPFQYEGREYEQLDFDFTTMTGNDYINVENEVLAHGKTVITPQFSTPFLVALAARACTTRSEDGRRVPSTAIQALPIVEFSNLLNRVKNFFWSLP